MRSILYNIFIIYLITLFCNVNADDNIDANWMSYLTNNNTLLNQLNIPGTHDSGTYDIGKLMNNDIADKVFKLLTFTWITTSQIAEFSKTQKLDITEQLEHGIRYLDIRMMINDKNSTEIYISHEDVPCVNLKNGHYTLKLTDVLDECINFLGKHKLETIIIHLKTDSNPHDASNFDIGQKIASYTVLNTNMVPNSNNELYKDYFYNNDTIPTLGASRGKIVFVTRSVYSYNITKANGKGEPMNLGIPIDVDSTGGCRNYPGDGIDCYPRINGNYRFQDAYNLDGPDKWELVKDVLTDNVDSRYAYYVDNTKYYETASYNNIISTKFNNNNNKEVLTFNFMNMVRMDKEN